MLIGLEFKKRKGVRVMCVVYEAQIFGKGDYGQPDYRASWHVPARILLRPGETLKDVSTITCALVRGEFLKWIEAENYKDGQLMFEREDGRFVFRFYHACYGKEGVERGRKVCANTRSGPWGPFGAYHTIEMFFDGEQRDYE